MTFSRNLTATAALIALSACELSQEAATNSGFRTPNASGIITGGVDNDGQAIRRSFSDGAGGGFAFAGGTNDDGLAAFAGIIPATTGGAALTGDATFSATFTAYQITGINLSDFGNGEGFISGQPDIVSDAIQLTADFANGRLTGTSNGGELSVNGSFAGTDLGGSVTYLSVGGELDGVIGADRTVGAFHGNDEDTIFAGGFVGTP